MYKEYINSIKNIIIVLGKGINQPLIELIY